jgi:hypothetical protein
VSSCVLAALVGDEPHVKLYRLVYMADDCIVLLLCFVRELLHISARRCMEASGVVIRTRISLSTISLADVV